MHEHIFINMLAEFRESGLLNDHRLMCEEAGAFAAAGGRTIVDLTTAELTRGAAPDPAGIFSGQPDSGYPQDGSRAVNNVLSIKRLSEETGLNLIVGTGHFRDPYFDQGWIDRFDAAQIAERMVRDLTEGISGTGVRAGIIGEIGADKWHVSSAEERSFRAAARACRETGAAISTHASRWPVGIAQLDILQAEGVDPRRVIIGHSDSVNIPEYHEAIARRGAFVEFDTVRGENAYDTRLRVEFVRNLIGKGYLGHILLSHDVCIRSQLRINGGFGFDYIPTSFVPVLAEAGVGKDEIQQILVDNPRRALAGE
jgi:phosphotriesterase-related protein